jgi:hypothetical protein
MALEVLLFTFSSTIFSVSNWINMAAFAMMIFAPNHKYTKKICFVAPLFHAVLYAILIGNAILSGGFSLSAFATLEGVRGLFSSNIALLAGWLHYLAFDLFVAQWILENSKRSGIKHILVVPCLILTFLFGPTGLLAYFLIKTAKSNNLKWD